MTGNGRVPDRPAQAPIRRDAVGFPRRGRLGGRPWTARMLAAAACLLFAGCQGVGDPIAQPADGLRLFPSGLHLRSKRDALEEAVQNDPFPAAAQVGL